MKLPECMSYERREQEKRFSFFRACEKKNLPIFDKLNEMD